VYLAVVLIAALATIKLLGDNKSLKAVLNITAAVGCISFAMYFGLLISVWYLAILLVIFSIYDYVAVLRLGTMQYLAQKMYSQMVPAIFIFGDKKEIDKKIGQLSKPKEEQEKPADKPQKKSNSSILGSGDLALPSACVASAIYYLPKVAPFMLIGEMGGMAANAWLLSTGKFKRGLPALVCITTAMIIFLIIGLIV
jgi:presenilin-like A22 family membrane protease